MKREFLKQVLIQRKNCVWANPADIMRAISHPRTVSSGIVSELASDGLIEVHESGLVRASDLAIRRFGSPVKYFALLGIKILLVFAGSVFRNRYFSIF